MPGAVQLQESGSLVTFGDEDPHTADGLVQSFHILADYAHYEVLGEVLVDRVYDKGDIIGNPKLEEAPAFGAGIR